MSVSSSIKSTLKTRIQALSTVQAVYGYQETNPSGYPAVIITPANLEGEFTSTTENSRVYGYNITVLFPCGQKLPNAEYDKQNEQAEEIIADVLEQIINDIDRNFELTEDTNVLFANAADAEWGFVEYPNGIAKACRITCLVRTDFNVN